MQLVLSGRADEVLDYIDAVDQASTPDIADASYCLWLRLGSYA
jgi:hypothetical protein